VASRKGWILATLALALAVLTGTATARTLKAPASAPKAPAGLAFYRPSAKLLAGKPGSVIWSRTIHTPAQLSAAATTTLVLYRSVLPNGKPAAVSGLIFTPRGKAPKNGWKLITWAHGTTGIADVCAPSRDANSDYVYPQFNQWLKKRYAIAQTDYQGLGTPGIHMYLIGRAEGASVDDIVLAARSLDPEIGNRFAIGGHSQGGQAALFAAAMAGRDGPSNHFLGVVAFAPASHLLTQVQAAPALTSPGGGLSGIGALIVAGAAADSSTVDLHALLSPSAYALLPQVYTECLSQLSEPNSWGGLAPSQIVNPSADPTAIYKVLNAENPALKINAPVLIVQGEADTTVFPAFTDKLDTELVAKGDKVTYTKLPGVDHGSAVAAGFTDASKSLASWFSH
jgi:pimeloyl-ACP methyl ester carboxylesterase